MLIEGPIYSGKTSLLIKKYTELVSSGVSTSQILVICSNKYKQKIFTTKAKENLSKSGLKGFGSFNIYTFNGIAYNCVANNWPLVDKSIPESYGNSSILPELCGMELSEYLLKMSIKEKNDKFTDYNSKMNLLHQLLRRHTLISQNRLTPDEISQKSELLNESFAKDAKEVLDLFIKKTLALRSFDYLRQMDSFLYLLKSGKIKDFDNIKYVFADDVDELPYSAQEFLMHIVNKTEDFYLAADPEGSSRAGFLCANLEGWQDIKNSLTSEIITLVNKSPLYQDAKKLSENITNEKYQRLENITNSNYSTRAEMIASAISNIDKLLEENSAEDLCIITPIIDEHIKWSLKEHFDKNGIKYQFLSGTKRLIDDYLIHGCLLIAQLINDDWQCKPTPFEIRILLTGLLEIPITQCQQVIDTYKKNRSKELKELELENKEFNQKYKALTETIKELKSSDFELRGQLQEIFKRVILPNITEDTTLEDFNSVLNSLENFINAIKKFPENSRPQNAELDWLKQIKNTIVSDNPPSAPEIQPNTIVIATPQKIVDLEIKTKFQIWLDTSHSMWMKDDTGYLYNAWVFQKNWDKGEYTPELHHKLTNEKTSRVIRKLSALANSKIYGYSSITDSLGNETSGSLSEFILSQRQKDFSGFAQITPREDQKAVVEYKGGRMAVPAVPGAGKTTIMQALIIELLKSGAKPSEIVVLTYMESAAKNFLDRIKKNCPDLREYPQISTIHGLAYKIIQDEDNCTKLGLDNDFRICDDIEKPRIINEICAKHLPVGEDLKAWLENCQKGFSKAKFSYIHYREIEEFLNAHENQHLREFLPVYKEYCQTMEEKNLLDFDDLIVNALKLLRDYPAILSVYKQKFKYIIEDEAQDSTPVQQEILELLSSHHGNLIRCGDVNQSIMSTFTNSDVNGFKEFIKNNKSVPMSSSQRCAKDVYGLANYLIDWSKTQPYTKEAFLDLKMQPADDKNPVVENSLDFKIHETTVDEKEWVASEIKAKLAQNPYQTVGLLARNNWQVLSWAKYLENAGRKVICRTDSLKDKKVFSFLLKFIEVIDTPWDNKLISELLEEFCNAKIYPKEDFTAEYIKNNLKTSFISYKFGSNEEKLLESEKIVQFWWDINYWLEFSYLPPEELIIKIGNYYFEDILDISNVHLFSALIKKYKYSFNDYSDITKVITLPDIVKYFKKLSNQGRISGVKFFSEEQQSDKDKALAGFVQIMTLHKAKGDEFDVVFMPEMYESGFPMTPDDVRENQKTPLIQSLENMSKIVELKTDEDFAREQIEETLRLIYVGVTRAKKYLYLSGATQRTKWKGFEDVEPSLLLEHLIEKYTKKETKTGA